MLDVVFFYVHRINMTAGTITTSNSHLSLRTDAHELNPIRKEIQTNFIVGIDVSELSGVSPGLVVEAFAGGDAPCTNNNFGLY